MTNRESIKYVIPSVLVAPWIISGAFEFLPNYPLARLENGAVGLCLLVASILHLGFCICEPGYVDDDFILTKKVKK